ncbi:ROK family protein [Lichenihabitans sp. Uapishka_5]|uniref:ROK family protein n=1 Tax=Lichenihabitans sp. Uapishka_5 TaxID=3037302 RepID=UPI0029E7E3FA|nr:ROK family protein [Lichenihabitans sp. Uapishka_5]MDX7949664.1 ROK family protein [Lichenihabitans sp. Uapishka_5]
MTSSPEINTSATHPPRGICADVGGSFIKSVVLGATGVAAAPQRRPTPAGDWNAFRVALQSLCADLPGDAPLALSIAGIVDPESGMALSANVPCITGRRLGAELSQDLGRAVLVANDADCMVLAEAMRGAATGHRVVFGIVLGSGVGGGLVVDGRIVEGAGGIAGEWGHGPILGATQFGDVVIPPLACGCGQSGCLDTLGGAVGLERLHRLLHGIKCDSRTICAAWSQGEPQAGATIAAWLDLLAGPLAMVVNATGAGIVPVSGGLGNDPALIEALDHAVRRRILRRSREPLVVPSRFGDAAGLEGAAEVLNTYRQAVRPHAKG